MENENKNYTLSEESLRKLLTQSYRSGALNAYQTLYDSMEMNIKPEHFPNKEMVEGFNYCKSMIYAMITVASKTLDNQDEDV